MNRSRTSNLTEPAAAFVAILWLGMVLGVSFIATPVKFQAPSLSLPVALEIGRATFLLFSKIEWAIAALLILALLAGKRQVLPGVLAVAAVALLVAETFWLLPVLDARVEAIISGVPIPADWHHFVYIGIETIKIIVLSVLSIYLLRKLTVTNGSSPSERVAPCE